MKKLLIGLTLISSLSVVAVEKLERSILDTIELDYNVSCEYKKRTEPCLTNYKCTNTVTYDCKDNNGKKRVGVDVIKHARHANNYFNVLGLKEVRVSQIQDDQEQQPQQAQQLEQAKSSQKLQIQDQQNQQAQQLEQVKSSQKQQSQNPHTNQAAE